VKFVSLHHHSTYSFLDGYGHPSEHVQRAVDLDMRALALTEHGNVSSHPKLERAATEAGIKPIFGCELYCGAPGMQRKNHLSVWAQDEEGYRNLLRMLTIAWTKEEDGGGFYYQPTVHGNVLSDHSDGLIVASGCTGSLLATSLIGGKNIEPEDASYDRGLRVASRFRSLLGDRYYLETQAFPELTDATCKINPLLARISRKLKIPLVATQDVHYCMPDHNEMQVILHAVRPGQNLSYEEQARSWGYDVLLCHPQSDAEVVKKLVGTGLTPAQAQEAVENTGVIADRTALTLPKAAPLHFPLPRGVATTRILWMDLLREGWRYRRISDKERVDEYAARLKYEVEMIESKDFIDYFLIVSDMVRWAKDHGIFVGPARGSAAGSLVCYLLRITEVDPMLFRDLIFERFIDTTRMDLPDIDLDYDDRRRHEVFEYLSDKYGHEYVSMLGTFGTYKPKLALDDVARVFRVPQWEVNSVKDLLLERSSGDLRASAGIEDTVATFDEAKKVFDEHPDLYKSMKLEGMVKGMGRHAAGVLVSSTPLTETCAVYGETVSIDKHDAEYLNLLKIDNLGLSNCGMLDEAAQLLGADINLFYELPLDDPATLQGFKDDDLTGIFQFDGRAMRIVNRNLKPDNFYEVCTVNALARPGPLHNNSMIHYVEVKHGERQPEAVHPLFDDIVKDTQWQVVYQEQILRIVREIGNFDWTAAASIRKIMSKKQGEQAFNREWERFWKGAKENGFTEDQAKNIWGLCITAGAYAFNAAHSVSYGMLGWWTMWLKQHHPLVFYVSALRRLPDNTSSGSKASKHHMLMRDAARHGIKVQPPDIERSEVTWTSVGDDTLLAGFEQIPGVGSVMAQKIVDYRDDVGLQEWEDLINVKGIGNKTIAKYLEWVYAEDPLQIYTLDRQLEKIKKEIEKGKLRGRNGTLPTPTHTVETFPDGKGKDISIVWMGSIVNRNLRDLYEVNFSRTGVELDPETVKDPNLREWVLLHGTDGDDILTITIDRWKYPRFKEVVWRLNLAKDIVLIRGVKKGHMAQKQLYVSEMWVLE